MGCAGHGTCSKDNNDVPVCTCEAPYTGAACDELECPENCNGKGVCEHQDLSGTPKCTCQEGFTGETCSVTCPNGQDNNGTTEVCGGHGECFAEHGKAECICSPAYSGISCQAMCNNGCMGRGECGLSEQGVPTCRCDAGYSGDSCQFTTCLNDCSGHGSCDGDGSCTCDREHEGEDCSQRRCPDGCNGHGTCDPIEFTCDCVMGWLDDACSEKVSCVNDCNGHGDCMVERDPTTNALLPQCDCHGEWHGPACGRQMCPRGVNTLSCSGHGSCGDDGQCACDGMFEGSACEQHDCTMSKSIGGANATECSGHGTCQEAACVCDLGYTDSSCSIRSCPSFDNKLCGGKGSCDPDGTCACLKEWEGEACHLKTSIKDLPTLPTQDIKSVVVKSLIATLRWTTKMEADQVIPGTTYEIFGYDIVLDNELNPYLCEINETPNMGLEVNYHSDYHGLGAAIEQQDYTYKTELMDATLAVADVEPRYSMNDLNEIKLEILDIIRVNNLACLMEDRVVTKGSTESSTEGQKSVTDVNEGDGSECLNDSDLEIIVKLESELKRSDNNEYEQVFPCVE